MPSFGEPAEGSAYFGLASGVQEACLPSHSPKFDAIECQEDSEAEEIASVQPNCLRSAGVAQVLFREQGQCPSIHRNVWVARPFRISSKANCGETRLQDTPCVATKNTSAKKRPVMSHTFGFVCANVSRTVAETTQTCQLTSRSCHYFWRRTVFNRSSMLSARSHNVTPTISWMGTIQLLRLPKESVPSGVRLQRKSDAR